MGGNSLSDMLLNMPSRCFRWPGSYAMGRGCGWCGFAELALLR